MSQTKALLRLGERSSSRIDFTDLFCGAGGASSGLVEAGWELVLGINHWLRAIETHSRNFKHADHWCEDTNKIDMRRLPWTRALWASPICTEATPANGQKRRPKGQLDIFEQDGHVDQPGFERTRATFYDVMRATEVRRYDVVVVENVVDVSWKWELFDWWIQGMVLLGYNYQFVSVSSAHVGGDDNPFAPQWRDRLYIVFTKIGIPLPDVSPRPTAWCPVCEAIGPSYQAWKNPDKRRIGKYRAQYVYRCVNDTCRHAIVEPLVLPATAAIDWTDLGTPIGSRKKTKNKPEGLAPSTMTRIRAGESLLGRPVMIVQAGANTYERPGSGYVRAWPVETPLCSRTGTAGDALAVSPQFSTGLNFGMVVPVGGNNHNAPVQGLDMPMAARVCRETDGVLIDPAYIPDAFYVKNFGGNCLPRDTVAHVSGPFGSITGKDHHALVVPYRKGNATTTMEPLHTMATRDSAGLVVPEYDRDVANWLFRMLKPREHLRAQRFRDDYEVTGNPGEQTMQAGNAVSVNVPHWLGTQIAEVLI